MNAPTPKQEITPEEEATEVERTLRLSVYEGSATVVFINWTAGSVLAGYLIYLGSTPLQLSMAVSVPFLAQAVAPLTAWLQSHYPHPRSLCTIGALLARTIWLIPALLPFFIAGGNGDNALTGNAPSYLILLIALSSMFQAGVGTIWAGWMGALVPAERRGRYFGFRNGVHAVVGLLANIGAGLLLDYIEAPYNFQVVFFGGVLFAWVGINLYRKHYEPADMHFSMSLKETLHAPLRDKNFRNFLRFAVYWQAAVLLGAPFVYPYLINHLQLTFTQIAIYQAIAAVTTLAVGPLWGHVADKVGNKAVLSLTTLLAGFVLPLSWLLASPGDPTFIYLGGLVDGIAWSALTPAVFNLALATAEPRARTAYVAMMSLATGLAGFGGGVLAGLMLEYTKDMIFVVRGYEWTGYHTVFLVSMMFRSTAFLLIAPIQETKSWRTRDVIRAMLTWRISGFSWR